LGIPGRTVGTPDKKNTGLEGVFCNGKYSNDAVLFVISLTCSWFVAPVTSASRNDNRKCQRNAAAATTGCPRVLFLCSAVLLKNKSEYTCFLVVLKRSFKEYSPSLSKL
jgi:hypothetical protein